MFETIGNIISIPFAALLRFFYSFTASYGWSLVLFTLAVKLVLLPFQLKSKKSMLRMARLQPKAKEIQAKYADNREKQNEEVAKLYQEEGINPMSGCLWSMLPLPILLALYAVIRKPLSNFMMLSSASVAAIIQQITDAGYTFQSAATYQEIEAAKYIHEHFGDFSAYVSQGLMQLDYNFFGIDLAAIPWNFKSMITTGGWPVIGLMLIPVLSAATSLLMSLVATRDSGAQGSSKSMMLLMPLMSLYIAFIMPAALGIYWIAQNVFSILQELILSRHYNKVLDAEEAERQKKKEAERKFRQEEARRQAQQQREQSGSRKKEVRKNEEREEKKASTNENGRIGERPYARGRSFREEHYE